MIKKTIEATTQLAKVSICLPLRHHWKSPYPVLNQRRLHETHSTDTWFASEPAITGESSFQILCGKEYQFIITYGMSSES